MRQGNFLGQQQEVNLHPQGFLSPHDRIKADGGVRLHDLKFSGSQGTRLQQNMIGNTDLAYVVQRRRLEQEIDVGIAHDLAEPRVPL